MKSLLIVIVACVLVGMTSAANNCPGAANTAGVNCTDASLCCGANSISPSCLPADGSKKCCTHFESARQCNPDEVCGGSGGPGASSYAQCGPPGSTSCNEGTGQGTFCNATLPTCCATTNSFCCAAGCSCNNSYYTCSCPQPTTPAPTTPAPAPKNNCPGAGSSAGVNCTDASLCCGYGTIYPSCLPANGTKKCCSRYLGATQCDQDQVCGYSGGPGASSYAYCGPPGSTFCDAGTGQGTFCNATKPTCCASYGAYGFCCAPGCACNTSYYTCSCPTPSTAAPTSAPTTRPIPTTKAPTVKPTQKPKTCKTAGPNGKPATCGANQKCCGARNTNAFCCPANKSCNNAKRRCV